MILDLNDSLCNININIDPYLLIEMVLLKYVKTSDNYFPGNNLEEKMPENKAKIEDVKFSLTETPIEEVPKKRGRKPKVVDDTPKSKIAVDIRINNTFVNADKKYKSDLSDNWVDFMNYLMGKDRSLISLLADTSILAASDCYALIQSKIDSTNDLINDNITLIEKYFSEYSGNNYKFAAVNNELWKISVDKYRINMKNKIKYSYMEEEIPEASEVENTKQKDDIEDLAKDIFGSYDVE